MAHCSRISLLFLSVIYNICISAQLDCGCNINRVDSIERNSKRSFSSYLNSYADTRMCPMFSSKYTNHDFADSEDMVLLDSGQYRVGTDKQVIKVDKEGPAKLVHLNSFYIDLYEVSNNKFEKFAVSTGYITEAEKFGNSFVFQLFLNDSFKATLKDYRVASAPWWYRVDGATWKHPEGPDSSIIGRMNHPVVHVSWNDAQEYCKWVNKRLPTEHEWEAACRAKHPYRIYPWGDKLMLNNKHWANIWQGTFPSENRASDGYVGTNPVDKFVQNDLGLCNMAGNVWEWTEDFWDNPLTAERVKKGGSYLCHKAYCFRYRCSARSQNTQDSSAHNLGFRCVKDVS